MTSPKLHHYVPRFYLEQFTDSAGGGLWVWDKDVNRVFRVDPKGIAAQTHFYRLRYLEAEGHDSLALEKQLSSLEGSGAALQADFLDVIRKADLGDSFYTAPESREEFALFIAVQYFRTVGARELLFAFIAEFHPDQQPTNEDEENIYHSQVLWEGELVPNLKNRLNDGIWIFARNGTSTPFQTSDNPVLFKTSDNTQWTKLGAFSDETYAVYPISPDVILYIYPRIERWKSLERFDLGLSPVVLDEEMVQHENSGQIFNASRFVISSADDFAFCREFVREMLPLTTKNWPK